MLTGTVEISRIDQVLENISQIQSEHICIVKILRIEKKLENI